MSRVSPVLLIGLGDDGAAAVRAINASLTGERPVLRPIVSSVTLDSSAHFTDLVTGDTLSVAPLQTEFKPAVFASNYEALLAGADALEPWLADRIVTLLRQDIRMPLEDAGYTVDTTVRVLIVCAMGDPIGSSAVVPTLTVLQSLLASRMRGSLFETDILALFPDVIPLQRNADDMYGRAYTFVQELEHVAENPELVGIEGNAPFNNVFLFSSRNEEGLQVADSEDLVNMIGEFLGPLLRREFASDSSYALALTREIEGKTTRYSSFGLSKLVFPVDRVMKAISTHHYLSYLRRAFGDGPPKLNADLLSADVRDFVGNTALDRLSLAMRTSVSGATIFEEFQYPGSTSEKVGVDVFLNAIEEESEKYSRTVATRVSRSLATRREELLASHYSNLNKVVTSSIDSESKGPYYASAFVDVLRDHPSNYVREDGTTERYALSVVEANAKAFFDHLFNIDRPGLARLSRDLTDKRALLVERQKALDKSTSQTAELTPAEKAAQESLANSIKALASEIKTLEESVAERSHAIAAFDLKISDAADRRAMLKEVREDEKPQREEKITTLRTVDGELRSAESRLADLYELRRRIALKLAVYYPAALVAALLVLSMIGGRILAGSVARGVAWSVRPAGIGLAIYALWAGFTYFNGIRAQVAAGELEVERKQSEKRNALVQVQRSYADSYKTAFEHELNSGLIGWIGDYKTKATDLSARLNEFISTIERSISDRSAALEALTFPNTPLLRSAVSKADLETLIRNNTQAVHEEISFQRSHPLSGFFQQYGQTGDLSRIEAGIDRFTEEVYAQVRVQSVEMMVVATAASEPKLLAKLDQLYQSSKAFIQLSVESGSDPSQTLVYIGTETDEPSKCKQLFGKIGGGAKSFFSTGDRYQLTAARLKVGFPAFQVALIPYGRRVVKAGDERRFAVDRDWELTDILPSLFTAGTPEDPARRLVCLGLAYQVITQFDDKGYVFDRVQLGKSLEEAVDSLRRASNSKVRAQVTARIDAAQKAEGAFDELTRYRSKQSRADPIDLEILDRVIAELNPLA